MFTAHIYPFLNLFSKYKCAYMPHPTIAVSSDTSQCHTDIYESSPTQQWLDLYTNVIGDEKHKRPYKEMVHRLMRDYMGFAQIKNYGTMKELRNEIRVFTKNDKLNYFLPKFWVFSLGSILIPRKCLISMISFYKNRIGVEKMKKLHIKYDVFPIDEVETMWTAPVDGERER